MNRLLTLIAFVLCSICTLQAQSVSGIIINENNSPIECANIALLGTKDSVIIAYGVSDESGNFAIQCKEPNVLMKISYVGYQTLYQPCTTNNTNFGSIKMHPNKILDEVVVIGKRPILSKKVDRMIYNVSNDVFAKDKTGMELLEQTPRIIVEKHRGSITMVGRSGVKVMLDGRMLEDGEAQSLLKNLRSEEIQRIEVIPIPPSKYSAEGNVGIINVVLKKDPTMGLLGNVSFNLSRNAKTSYFPSASINYRNSKWEVRLGITSAFLNGEQENTEAYTYADHTLSRNEHMDAKIKNYMGNALVKFKPNKRLEIGVLLNGGYEDYNFQRVQNTSNRYLSGIVPANDSIVDTDALHKPRKNSFNISFYTDIALDTLGKKLSLTYNSHYKDNSVDDNFLATITKGSTRQPMEMQTTGMYRYRTNSLLADFALPYRFAQIEAGASMQMVNNYSDLQLGRMDNGNLVIDPSATNNYKYKEQIYAGYIMANKNVGEKLMLKAGVRYEYTHVKGFSPTVNKETQQNYGEWFPTAFMMWMPSNNHNLSLSYTRRVDRPYFEDLNPFIRYKDVNSYSKGNSDLRTQPSDNMELGYTFKGNLNVILWGNYQRRLIDYVPMIDANGMRTEAVLNSNTCRKAGFTVSYNFAPVPWWSTFVQGSVFYSETECIIPELKLEDMKGYGGNFNIYSNFMLNRARTLQAGIFFNQLLPSCDNLTISRGSANLGASISYSLLNDRLFLSLSANDIFRQNKPSSKRYYQDYKMTNVTDSHIRSINLSVSWKFGKKSVNSVDKQTRDMLNGRDSK